MKSNIDRATSRLIDVLHRHPCLVSSSMAKDSSALLVLTFRAMMLARQRNISTHPVCITHSDTEVDNPAMAALAHDAIERIERFIADHQLNARIAVTRPSLASSWAVRTIGSGKLPVWPGQQRDCAIEYKLRPQDRLRRQVLRELRADGHGAEPVVLTGMRFEESLERERRMRERNDDDERLRRHGGTLYLSPLAAWSTRDVFECLQIAGAGHAFPSYSDFRDLEALYGAASHSSCPIIGSEILGEASRQRGDCGRFGCWCCTVVSEDHSLHRMIEQDPTQYAYMAPLVAIQRWLGAIRYAYEDRQWLGRTIDAEGRVRIQPDLLGPEQVASLLRYCLSADAEEAEASSAAGIAPRFSIISPEKLIAIDATWSQLGFHRPFEAIRIYEDVYQRAQRERAPRIEPPAPRPRPAPRYLHVGRNWEDGLGHGGDVVPLAHHMGLAGLATNAALLIDPDAPCAQVRKTPRMEVDTEGALLFLEFEAARKAAEFANVDETDPLYDPTEGYRYYLRLGVLSVAGGGHEQSTRAILRRTYYRHHAGLHATQAPQALYPELEP